MFKNQSIYLINTKLDEPTLDASKQLIQRNGGELAETQQSADVLLTTLKSSSRIKRHLKNRQIPVADVGWLKDCVKEKQLLPLDKYRIPMDEASSTKTRDTTSESKDNKGSQDHDNKGSQGRKTKDEEDRTYYKDGHDVKTISSEDHYLPKPSSILTKDFANSEPDVLSYDETDASNGGDSDKDSDIDPKYNNTKYECLRPTPYRSKHNGKLVAYLRLLEQSRELETNDKNALAYRHATSAIKAYPRKIRSAEEAGKIKGVGAKIKEVIRIYLETGKVPEAEALLSDTEFQTLRLFNKCFGVGPATAKTWWDTGYRTLQQVLDNATLTATVRLGIQLLPDFIQPMKRSDVEELIGIIEKEASSMNEQLVVTPVGGYRRGKELSGDLDIIISSKQQIDMADILLAMTDRLKSKGHIKHVLWKSRTGSTKQDRYHKQRAADMDDNEHDVISKSLRRSGFDDLPKAFTCFMQPSTGISRQVDFIIASFEEYPTAVLGWTGSRQFERSIREYAKKEKNIKLSSHEMVTRSMPERRISVSSEKDIFDALDIDYISPQYRNC